MADNPNEMREVDLSGGRSQIPPLYQAGVPKSFCVRNALEAMSLEASGQKPETFYDQKVIREFDPSKINKVTK